MQTLERHAFPVLGTMSVDRISRADVLAVLASIWGMRQETARRVRQRIRARLRWAQAHRYVEKKVPDERNDGALPRMLAVKSHFRGLPCQDVPAALATVEATAASMAAKLCFRFLILTAARSGEARGATWSEIDFKAKEWRMPARRMVAGAEHRVPLSDPALAALARARDLDDRSGLVFPSSLRKGMEMSDMTLTKLLRTTGLAGRATVHGFRSSFRDWAAERTDTPHAVMELGLAHNVGNSVEQAYTQDRNC